MGYIIAILVVFVVLGILGFLLSFLWPLIVGFVVFIAISSFFAYRQRKKTFERYYRDSYQEEFPNNSSNSKHRAQGDDIIDVEFSEEDIEE